MQSKEFGRQPIRFTGQHFTKSSSLINRLILEAGISKSDLVLDIGAGKGALTEPLSKKAKKVVAVERDLKLAKKLKHQYKTFPNITILPMDFRNMPLPNQPFKVVSNIPYCITRDILGRLMDGTRLNFIGGTIVMEWGAALKLVKANQSSPEMVIWNTFYDIKLLQKISPNAFQPPPKVNSALVKFSLRQEPLISRKDYSSYKAFVNHLLNPHGVPMKQALRKIFTRPQVKRIVSNLGINRDSSIQTLTPKQWAKTFYVMKRFVPKGTQP